MSDQDYHVFMLDNGSEQAEADRLRDICAKAPKISYKRSETNLGYTDGSILQWEWLQEEGHDNSEYIILLNNDTSVHVEWLAAMRAFAQRNGTDIVSSRLVDYTNRQLLDNTGHFFLSSGEVMPAAHGEPMIKHHQIRENWGACAAAAMYRTSMINEIGFFDPFFETGYEDAELGLRARLTGYKCLYCPTAVVYHKGSVSVNKVMSEAYLRRIQVDIFYTYKKLMPLSYLIINAPMFYFKHVAILFTNLIFTRWDFLRISLGAMRELNAKHRRDVRHARRGFQAAHGDQLMPWWKIYAQSTFFLWLDIQRFWHLMIMDRKSKFE